MSLSSDVVALFRCPQSGQPLHAGEAALVIRVNKFIDAGNLLNQRGGTVKDRVDGLLIREDKQVAYPIRDDLAELIADSAFMLEQL